MRLCTKPLDYLSIKSFWNVIYIVFVNNIILNYPSYDVSYENLHWEWWYNFFLEHVLKCLTCLTCFQLWKSQFKGVCQLIDSQILDSYMKYHRKLSRNILEWTSHHEPFLRLIKIQTFLKYILKNSKNRGHSGGTSD